MIRLISSSAAIAATLALAACGGSGSTKGGTSTSSPGKPTVGGQNVVVDRSGKALYAPDAGASGIVLCTGACESFWKPAAPGAVPQSAGKVGSIIRPDGSRQATIAGRPVYTFVEDSPGKLSGNGFTDDFGGHHFVWHAVLAGGKTASTSSGGSSSGASDNGNGYGY